MKRWILLVALGCVFWGASALADVGFETQSDIEKQTEEKLKTLSWEQMLELTQNPAQNEELLLQMVLSEPEEYHQYIMPALGAAYGISEKLRMMPVVAKWRGKVPTRIAPELFGFAKEHLLYLNPAFYPLLMPEAWPSYSAGHEEEHEALFLSRSISLDSPEELDQAFPSALPQGSLIAQMMRMPQDISSQPENAQAHGDDALALTEAQVEAVVDIFEQLRQLEQGPQGKLRTQLLVLDFIDQNKLLEAMENPCASLVERLPQIEGDVWLKVQLKRAGMSKEQYINRCDRVIKAYRVAHMSSGGVEGVLSLVKKALKMPKDSYQRRVFLMQGRMLKTSSEDIEAVKKYQSRLNKLFSGKLMIMSTPVFVDF